MSKEGCGCTNNQNCPNKTSEVNLWDGAFTTISVPSGSGLNEVLSLLENFVLTSNQCNDVNFTLDAYSACLDLAAGTYSFNQIIDAIVAKVCSNASDIYTLQQEIIEINNSLEITTNQVTLEGIIMPSCFSSFTGTTSTLLFQLILNNLCSLLSESGPTTDTPIVVPPPDSLAEPDPGGTSAVSYNKNARIEHLAEVFKSFLDNNSFLYDHTMPVSSPTSFTVRINQMRGVVYNYLVIRNFTEDLTVNSLKDTYFYLSGDSTILRKEVANGSPAPVQPITSHLIYKVISDGSGISSLTIEYNDSGLNPIPLGADDVDTVNIVDDAVTSNKISDVTIGNTVGHLSLFLITNNDKGQVTSLQSNLLLSGLANGHVLKYNGALNRFENSSNLAVPSAGRFPVANGAGDDFVSSSLYEAGTQVEFSKKIEINTGAIEDDPNAILNLSGGALKLPRLTAAEASALPVTDSYFIYVTTLNGTFTSVGFWGVENSTWIKL